MKEFAGHVRCARSAEIVTYVYNEMSNADRDLFDNHLADCSSCIEELAELSHSYYSVYEWRKQEFDPIPTPLFVLPKIADKVSLIDRFRAMFLPSPAWMAAGSFAALFITVAVGFIVWNGSSNSDLASISSNKTAPANNISDRPSFSVLPEPGSAEPEVKNSSDERGRNTKVSAQTAAAEKRIGRPSARSVKIAAPSPSAEVERGNGVMSTTVPQLTEFDEVQDDSLRLSDILEDIDTGD